MAFGQRIEQLGDSLLEEGQCHFCPRKNVESSCSSVKPCLHAIQSSAIIENSKRKSILTRIHPLHPIGKCVIRNQIVSSPSRICENSVCIHHHREQRSDKR